MPDGHVKKIVNESVRQEHYEAPTERGETRPSAHVEPMSPLEVSSEGVAPAAVKTPVGEPIAQKSSLLQDIENVLEENLTPIYKELSPRQKQQFKVEGERVARNIEELLKRAKIAVIEIIRLIRRWLRMIPGINIFFLEQEAKIKAERIIALKNSDSK